MDEQCLPPAAGPQSNFGNYLNNAPSPSDYLNNMPPATGGYLNGPAPDTGFGSYLNGIVPNDIAVTAGAFAAAIQQIKNIQSVDFEKFAQVAASIETTKGLNQINGTNVPVDLPLAEEAATLTALGSGPNGTYTMSDFFGSMSGIPYMWNAIQKGITATQTSTLADIYANLYLAVTWEQATASVQYTTDPNLPSGPTTYTITGVTITNSGGGYGREGASAPVVTVNGGSGAVITATIGTDKTDGGSKSYSYDGTYGRVTQLTISNYGSASTTIPTVSIAAPTGGGWPGMNTTIQTYIDAANTEIIAINSAKPLAVANLNAVYNAAGSQLTVEQRTRWSALSPAPIVDPTTIPYPPLPSGLPGPTITSTRDPSFNAYPGTIYSFVDYLPEFSQDTNPHMAAQTLEAISKLDTTGGQSAIAKMREERNSRRLVTAGIYQDNNIPGTVSPALNKLLLTNGTVPIATDDTGITVNNINGYGTPSGINATSADTSFTLPATLLQDSPTEGVIAPIPIGYTDPNTNQFKVTVNSAQLKDNTANDTPGVTNLNETSPITEILNAQNSNPNGQNILGIAGDGTGPAVPDGLLSFPTPPIAAIRVGQRLPIGPGTVLDQGQSVYPGSLAGTKPYNLLPINLNTAFTSGTLLSASYGIPEAIEQVITCNCDCWNN